MSPPAVTGPPDEASARTFVLKLGTALHASGHPAHRVEHALVSAAARLGLRGHFFSMPTALFASFDDGADQRAFLLRVAPGSVNLSRLAQLHRVARRVAEGELDAAGGSLAVDAILAAPPPFGAAVSTLAFAVTSGAAGCFIGGGAREVVTATVIGLLIAALALLTQRLPALGRVFEPMAAVVAAVVAALAARLLPPVSTYVATLAGLIVLMPGFPLTVSLMELATRNLMAGMARFAGTAVTFLGIAFGVALGERAMTLWLGAAPVVTPSPLPGWAIAIALVLAPLGFTVLLQAEARDAGWIVLAGIVAFWGARVGTEVLGPELGAFVGALLVGLASNAYARVRRSASAVTLIPGLLLLVPGSMGFRSISSLLGKETLVGVETAFHMTLVAISLAMGLLLSQAILPDEPPAEAR